LSDEGMRDMAKLLRSGARMLSQSCPECGSPLFQLKSGEIWCAKCQRRVIIVSEGEESLATVGPRLESLENVLVDKLSSLEELLVQEREPEKLKIVTETLNMLLTSLEKSRRIRKG
jgi:UPF0148 protein